MTEVSAPAPERAALAAFDRALGQEVHNLATRPELCWQQLHNRLQWEGEPVPDVLTAELERRTTFDSAPWARTRTAFRESSSLIRTLVGHTQAVECCAISPDGSYIVSASVDRTIRLWDPATGKEVQSMEVPTGESVGDCGVSPDSTYVVSAGGLLRLWDAGTGACVWSQPESSSCAVSPDGTHVISLGDDATRTWDLSSGKCTRVLDAAGKRGCAVSPDGTFLAAGSGQTVVLLDLQSGAIMRSLEGHTLADGVAWVDDCAVSSDGAQVASASHDGTVKLWDVASGRCIRTMHGHTGLVRACAISPDGAQVVSGGSDRTVRVWDAATGNELARMEGHTSFVTACAVSPDGSYAVSASGDLTLRLWHLGAGDGPETDAAAASQSHAGQILDCAVSPAGDYVVTAGADKILRIWDAASGTCVQSLHGHTDEVNACAVSSSAGYVVSASSDATVRIWESRDGTEARVLRGRDLSTMRAPTRRARRRQEQEARPSTQPVLGCAVHHAGAQVVSAGINELRLWDADSGEELDALATGRILGRCAVTLGGDVIAVGDVRGGGTSKVQRWSLETGRLRAEFDDEARAFALSPDGAYLASLDYDRNIVLSDAASGERHRILGHHTGASCLAVSPDAAYVLSGSVDGTFRLWEVGTGQEVVTIPMIPIREGLTWSRVVALHPWLPRAACDREDGSIHLIDLIGIEYGPIVATAIDRGGGATLRCPACWQEHRLKKSWLGEELDCPTADCELRLRVNPFVMKAKPPRRSLLARLSR